MRRSLDQHVLLIAAGGLHADSGIAIAMVVMAEVGEELAPIDVEAGAAMAQPFGGRRQRERQGSKFRQNGVGIGAQHGIGLRRAPKEKKGAIGICSVVFQSQFPAIHRFSRRDSALA